MLDDVVYIVL